MKQYSVRVSAALKKVFTKLGSKRLLEIVSAAEPVCPVCSQPWNPSETNARIGVWVDDGTASKLDSMNQKSLWLRAVFLKLSSKCVVCERDLPASDA